MSEDLRAAVAAAVLGSDDLRSKLLTSIVDVARAILGARASSIMLFDEGTDELVFEAVAGEGEATLIGSRIPADTGIAGWVLQSQEPLVIEDVASDPRFAQDVAERSGYVPNGLIALPLIEEERTIGVLSVLDRPKRTQFSLVEMDLLTLFASQAATALVLVERARRANRVLSGEPEGIAAIASLAQTLEDQGESSREAGLRLVESIEAALRERN